MGKAYSNKVADRAIGRANKEWITMAKIALNIRNGRCNPLWAEEQTKRFTGIFKRLLTDPIEEVEKEAGVNPYAEWH